MKVIKEMKKLYSLNPHSDTMDYDFRADIPFLVDEIEFRVASMVGTNIRDNLIGYCDLIDNRDAFTLNSDYKYSYDAGLGGGDDYYDTTSNFTTKRVYRYEGPTDIQGAFSISLRYMDGDIPILVADVSSENIYAKIYVEIIFRAYNKE